MPSNRKQPKKNKKTRPKSKGPTAIGQLIRTAGSGLGRLTGLPGADRLGHLLGARISKIFGQGDYVVAGSPSRNVLSGSIPQFSSTQATNIVCHREYIGDITGTTAFTVSSYNIQPGVTGTFPWLAGIAANYSQYRIHGMVFEFRSLITDFITGGAPGVVVLATNYNADDAAYTSKRQMENSEYATVNKPTENVMHLIECDPKQTSITELYTRTTTLAASQDYKTYDHGKFQVATQGNPVQLLGELWVTYCVEFFKPETNTSAVVLSNHITRKSAATTTLDFGATAVTNVGSITCVVSASSISYTGLTALSNYLIAYGWTCGGGMGVVPVQTVTVGVRTRLMPNTIGTPDIYQLQSGGLATNVDFVQKECITSDSNGIITITTATGTLSASNTFGFDSMCTPYELAIVI